MATATFILFNPFGDPVGILPDPPYRSGLLRLVTTTETPVRLVPNEM